MRIKIKRFKWIPHVLSGLYFRNFDAGLRKLPEFPPHIDIEVTNACNLQCMMCTRNVMTRNVTHMKFELFRKIVDEIAMYGLRKSWLNIYGEPLLDPGVFEKIKYIKRFENIKDIGFSTNCFFLDEESSKKIIESGLDRIIFGIDGATKKTYEKVRIGSNFEKVTRNIKTFFEIRKRMKTQRPVVELQYIKMIDTEKEIRSFVRQWANYLESDDILHIKSLSWQNFTRDIDSVKKVGLSFRVPCSRFLLTRLDIFSDGRATVCCNDVNGDLCVGDVNKQSIKEIWQGKAYKRIRQIHRNGDFRALPICDKCEVTTKHCEIDLKEKIFAKAMKYNYFRRKI